MKRHSILSVRTPERVSKARAGITEEDIRAWFACLKDEMVKINALDVFDDPSRVCNSDESNLQLCPKTGKVIGPKGWKNVYELTPGPDKSTLTFLGTFSASGEIICPAIIYPYQRIPRNIVKAIPDEFFVGTSETGWMKSENFFEFMANGFIPYVKEKKLKLPVILFVDGHKTHITLQVSVLCEENAVILYLLPPNTTHILQPADVGVFKPFKSYWKTAVHNFQRKNPNQNVRRLHVAPLLKEVLNSISKQTIINSFLATGLCPLNPESVDYSKCLEIDLVNESPQSIAQVSKGNNNGTQNNLQCRKDRYEIAKSVLFELLPTDTMNAAEQGQGDRVLVKLLADINEKLSSELQSDESLSKDVNNMDLSGNSADPLIGSSTITMSNDATAEGSNVECTINVDIGNQGNITQVSNTLILDHEEAEVTDLLEFPDAIDISDLQFICTVDEPGTSGTLNISSTSTDSKFNVQGDCSSNDASSMCQPVPQPANISSSNTEEALQLNKPCELPSKGASSESVSDSVNVSASKTEKTPYKHVFWEGKIQYRKRKPVNQLPAMISSKRYRSAVLSKTNNVKRKKTDDWTCVYCQILWSEDNASNIKKTWVKCDKCPLTMHFQCIPRTHAEKLSINIDNVNETDFCCESCADN